MIHKQFVQTYTAIVGVTMLGLYLINILDISYPLHVSTSVTTSELSVVGEGKVDVTPDTAHVNVGIQVSNTPTAEGAQEQISTINNKIIDAMSSLGIKKEDIKTSNYSVFPGYSNDGRTISGYNGNATISIKIKKTELVSQVVTSATNAGANEIHGVSFSIDDPSKFREQARTKAIEDAKEQAEKLAKNLGIRLGKVVNIVEYQPSSPIPFEAKSMALDAYGGGGGPSIEPGTQTVTSTVTLYFEKR